MAAVTSSRLSAERTCSRVVLRLNFVMFVPLYAWFDQGPNLTRLDKGNPPAKFNGVA